MNGRDVITFRTFHKKDLEKLLKVTNKKRKELKMFPFSLNGLIEAIIEQTLKDHKK